MSTVSAIDFDRIFEGRRVPSWLRRFEADPDAALQDLLLGRADLGHLSAAEPSEILLDWVEGLGAPHDEFRQAVDTALARWIKRFWGQTTLPLAGGTASVVAMAWVRASNLIAFSPDLRQAARALRSFLPEQRIFLSALSEGRARDPEGRAWLALARHQEDRTLLEEWWRLCALPPDVPWYHGGYGINGLRGLQTAGTFPAEVAEGLARLALALAARVDEGWLDVKSAESELTRTARLTMAAYPWEDRWISFWRHTLEAGRLKNETAREWIQNLAPQELKKPGDRRDTGKRWRQPDHDWREALPKVERGLNQRDWTVLEAAKGLLGEQQAYADATGDSFFVVHSACNFAGRVRESRPELAVEWARQARRNDPWNAFAWTTLAASLLTLGHLNEALDVSIKAVQRFPENAVARTGLGEILKAQGRLEESEAVYRETIKLFPRDPFAQTGLEGVLRARRGEREETDQPRSLSHSPARRQEVAEAMPRAAGESRLRSEDIEYLLQDAYLLRRWAGRTGTTGSRRETARKTLEKLVARQGYDAEIVGELGLFEIEAGELDRALSLLREAVKRFPGSARVRYSLARAEREVAARRGLLDAEHPEAPVLPWRRLGRMDERFLPLQLLGEGRTWLSQVDGSIVADNARSCFGRLGYWLQQHKRGSESETFLPWWIEEVQLSVFGEQAVGREEDIVDLEPIQNRIAEHAALLNHLEEDLVNRWARA